jgi:hypothetical protein
MLSQARGGHDSVHLLGFDVFFNTNLLGLFLREVEKVNKRLKPHTIRYLQLETCL